ncbi:MAG: transglutaminase-like domain-containing protein [Verrucomicrobiota bacterium]
MSVTTPPPARLTENQRQALIRLLADEDPVVFETIRNKLLAYGPEVMDWLKPHLLSGDPLFRKRVKAMLHHLQCQDMDNEFLTFCLRQGEDLDLEDAVWLLARTRFPEINPEGYVAILDGYAAELRLRLIGLNGAHARLGAIAFYLFQEQGFTGNEENYYDPNNSYLNKVLDRHTGNPISLCLVLLFVCQRLKLPVVGIGLPGHFICRYQTATDEIYIDAFNRGRLATKADCVRFLHATSRSLVDESIQPVSARKVLARICSNLHLIYQHLAQPEDSARFQRYAVALGR